MLLPPYNRGRNEQSSSTDMMILNDEDNTPQAWEWNISPLVTPNEDSKDMATANPSAVQLDKTIDEIARQLTAILLKDNSTRRR